MRIPIRLGAVVFSILAAPAVAQEFCVTCSAPDAKYRCLIGGEPRIGATDARGQLLCITELARTGGHASCSVGRTTEQCEGELRTVMYPIAPANEEWPVTEVRPEAGLAEGQGLPLAAGQGPQEPEPAETPQTVEQLAKDTAKNTGESLEKAGEAVTDTAQSAGQAIGNAAQKTWNCLSSFFSDC